MSSHALSQSQQDTAASRSRFYFFAWRWHFYAGLFVVPFLIMLAGSGLVMLYEKDIQNIQYANILEIKQPGSTSLPLSTLVAKVQHAYPQAMITQWQPSDDPSIAPLFTIYQTVGDVTEADFVAINPFTGEIQGDFSRTHGLINWLTELHGTLFIGDVGDRLIEIAASLGILLFATGLYLWLPSLNPTSMAKAIRAGFLRLRQGQGVRTFYRDLHANLGGLTSLFLLGFLLTGLAWAGIWGGKIVQPWATYPDGKYYNVAESTVQTHQMLNHGAEKKVPWNLELAAMPESQVPESKESESTKGEAAPQQSHASTNEKDSSNQAQDEDAHQAHHGAMQSMQYQVPAAHLDAVNAKAQQLGMQNYRILFPQSKTGVYTLAQDTISGDISDPRQERMLHLDQYSNEVLQDVTWQDYNLAAKLVATSVALHEGRITWLNKAFNTLLCIGLIILPITGLVIWWLRRPKHAGLASPKVPTKFQNVGIWKLGVVVLIGLSILFPLAGLSIFTVMLLDFLIISRSQKLSQWLK